MSLNSKMWDTEKKMIYSCITQGCMQKNLVGDSEKMNPDINHQHFRWKKHVRTHLDILTTRRPKQAASLHKHLKHYHKYFFIHIYPGRGPGHCYSSYEQTGNTSGVLKLYLSISSTLIILPWWQQKSTLEVMHVALTGFNTGFKRCQDRQWSSLLMITTSQHVFYIIFHWRLIRCWDRK